MSSQTKDYILSALIVVIAEIIIIALDLPKGTSIAAILIVIILSIFMHKIKILTD
ncbi:hypothetical protein [uncultured Exiguobacterium sp.]|uniref:hypothetical protein n=1 Tax=uncultured Exiguobacterium sp. TaxID=202669 RepID=UPI0037495D64